MSSFSVFTSEASPRRRTSKRRRGNDQVLSRVLGDATNRGDLASKAKKRAKTRQPKAAGKAAGKSGNRARSRSRSNSLSFGDVWASLKEQGWTHKSGRGLASYHYLRPGASDGKAHVENVDWFASEEALLHYYESLSTSFCGFNEVEFTEMRDDHADSVPAPAEIEGLVARAAAPKHAHRFQNARTAARWPCVGRETTRPRGRG